jgi:hypothetical protein
MIGYIYLLGSTTFGWYKIGKSAQPEVRIKTLGILLPFKVEVIGLWRADDYHDLELRLHEKHSQFRINGEWFRFKKKEVGRLLETMAHFIKIDTLSKFRNLENDAPKGKAIKIKFKSSRSPEELQRLKIEAMSRKAEKKRLRTHCPACRQPIANKEFSASENESCGEPTLKYTAPLIQ